MESTCTPTPTEAPVATPAESKVLRFPHPALLGKAFSVDVVNDSVREIAADLVKIMKAEDGVGLAAPQIGQNLRIVVVSAGPDTEPTVLCDPRIVHREGQVWDVEACLSLPGIRGTVMRSNIIVVEALGLDDAPMRFEARGYYARVIQHEVDHLDGILFTSRLGPADKPLARRKMEQLAIEYAIENGADEGTVRRAPPRKVFDYVMGVVKKQTVFAS